MEVDCLIARACEFALLTDKEAERVESIFHRRFMDE